VPLKNVGLTGEPAARIVTYTVDEDARYAVLCPRKRSPTGKALFGSVGQSVLLNANCPVVTTIEQK
jgi:nucleotide-binding universal stress UspA family protein